jgi:hypothetical protein
MGPHRHRNSHGSKHQGNERHQRQKAGRLVKASCQGGVRLTVVDDLGLWKQFDEAALDALNTSVRDWLAVAWRRNLEEVALTGM